MKKLLQEAQDPYLALLSYRATPLPWCDITPAELLMGRQLRTNLPQLEEHFKPDWNYLEKFRDCNEDYKSKQTLNYDSRHRVLSLPPIPDDTNVWITNDGQERPGRVIRPADTPRSYMVDTPEWSGPKEPFPSQQTTRQCSKH